MRIRDNLPPGSTARTAAAKPVARARNAEAASATAATSAAGVTAQADQATFLGLNETELSPNVRAALMALLDEVSRLRQELEPDAQAHLAPGAHGRRRFACCRSPTAAPSCAS